ncbi:MAG: hypothetical protein LC733_11815 [Actinobacteria bacterium]|nr:hypothetical protein [Actinomycetota bacterium]
MITGILAGIAAKLAGMGVAAKAAAGLGIATVATAGVAIVVPVVVPDAPGTTAAVEGQLPTVPTGNADRGLGIAADATSGQLPAGAQTGLDIARQTPAADHLPEFVPGPPASVPVSPNAGAAATGIDRARETPAGAHLPPFVPGPPASVPPTAGPPANVPPIAGPPANLPPAAGAGATGIDTATGTPGGQHIPPFVKGMFGRS